MVHHRIPIFDGDGHVYENENEIVEYFENEYKGARRFDVFSLFPSVDGWARGLMVAETANRRKYMHTDARVWSEMLDRVGLEGSVLYPTAGLGAGLLKEKHVSVAMAAAYNNWLEDRYTSKDDRLYGAGMVPVHDQEAAVREIRRCAEQRKNFVAMFLPARTSLPVTYGDRFFWPMYEEAERQGMPLAIHGGPSSGMGFDHFDDFCKIHTLSHPVSLLIQLTDIIFSGVFDAFPGLRIAFLEAGCTWVPFMMDRMDYEFDSVFGARKRQQMKKRPSEYLAQGDNFWVATELGEKGMKYAIDAMGGSDRIIYASDYPHEPTDDEIVGDVPEFLDDRGYDDDVKADILGRSAKRLYRLD